MFLVCKPTGDSPQGWAIPLPAFRHSGLESSCQGPPGSSHIHSGWKLCKTAWQNCEPNDELKAELRKLCKLYTPNLPGLDTWRYCDWCGRWGWDERAAEVWVSREHRLINSHWRHAIFCMRCVVLKEPPWFPVPRCHRWLLYVFCKTELAATTLRQIAEYLSENKR